MAVNPNVIKAQIEGVLGYGLDAILHGEITLTEGGAVEQSNFHNYAALRINEMPEVEVEIIKSDAPQHVWANRVHHLLVQQSVMLGGD